MGTDIHMAAEVRKNGKWHLVTECVFPHYDFDYNKEKGKLEFKVSDKKTFCPYDNRNYDLFAMLADVRNGFGFAGCVTGEHINPISKPKGYPEDMCDELRSDLGEHDDDWWDSEEYDKRPHLSDEHSGSYLTLKELLAYDWTQGHCTQGYLSKEEYASSIYRGEHPNSWCGGVGGKGVVHVSEETMRKIIEGTYPVKPDEQYYVFCTFPSETYAKKAGEFYDLTIPALKTLIPEGGTEEDVRIVFDFDS